MKPYPSYSQSKPIWLGYIPSHWKAINLRYLLQTNSGGVWGSEADDDGTIVLRSTDQTVDGRWQIDTPARRLLTTAERQSAALKSGDLVITKSSGSADHIGKTCLVDASIENLQACYSNFMQRIRFTSRGLPRFFWYVLNSELARAQFDYLSNSTTGLANLGREIIGLMSVAEPPLAEQHAIVSFLDRETNRLNALIGRKQRLLKLMEEEWRAVITECVTRGLVRSVPMKTASSYWLACIPAHWKLVRIANITTKITNGFVGPTRDILQEFGTKYIQSLHIKNGCILFDRGSYHVSDEWSAAHPKSILKKGDVLVVQTGAEVGQTALVDSLHVGCNCHALIILTPREDRLRGAFLELYLRSDIGKKYLESIQTGALHPHLNCTIIRDLYVPLPPLPEQDAIVTKLALRAERFERTRAKINDAVRLLVEFRSALITDAVTGKIDVRDLDVEEAAA